MLTLKMADGRHIEIVSDYNSAADCPILVKFGWEAVFTEFRQSDRYQSSTERTSCFPTAAWASASGIFSYRLRYFRIVSHTLVSVLYIVVFS